ncbi:PglL family O-oligosaccharyltransferase [Rhodoferax sp. WC2427]|uniref:PglL family O-oligosaccharyltransferase n=1 Tax=Rhodoferax sp. WC2427 TaxID=3234144 RepID=UPI0034650427
MRPAATSPAATGIATLLLALPWLNPFAPGPMAAMVPWLVALASVAGLLAVQAIWQPARRAGASGWAGAAAGGWLVAGALSCAIGMVQYFGVSPALAPWVNTTPLGEAFANLRQRNQFASLVHIALAALLWWVVQVRPAVARHAARNLAVALAILLAVGNAVSSSRTGLVQTALVVALAAVWGGWRDAAVRRVLLAFVLAYGLGLLLLPSLVGLDTGAWARLREGDALCSSRLTLWHNVLTLVAQHPWLGWGWGELDYAHYIHLYDGPRFCDILDNAHNLPLHLAVELGVPMAVAACGLLVWWVLRSQPWAETDASRRMAWTVLAVVGLHSLLEYPLWYGPFQIAVGLCVVLLWRTPQPAPIRKQAPVLIPYALAALFLIATCLYTAWDYRRASQVYMPPAARDPAYRDDPLAAARSSFLFQNQVQFAELSTTPLTQANARAQYQLALALLHFSPEHRVIERVIDSAMLLGLDDVAVFHMLRFKAAFPEAFADWVASRRRDNVQ